MPKRIVIINTHYQYSTNCLSQTRLTLFEIEFEGELYSKY